MGLSNYNVVCSKWHILKLPCFLLRRCSDWLSRYMTNTLDLDGHTDSSLGLNLARILFSKIVKMLCRLSSKMLTHNWSLVVPFGDLSGTGSNRLR